MAHVKIRNLEERRRVRRKRSIRKRIVGTSERPRLTVFRSNKHIYAQAVDDTDNKVLAAASDSGKDTGTYDGKKKAERAELVGQRVAEALKAKNVSKVVFDRNGFIYHGRVKAVAEGARKGGLEF